MIVGSIFYVTTTGFSMGKSMPLLGEKSSASEEIKPISSAKFKLFAAPGSIDISKPFYMDRKFVLRA